MKRDKERCCGRAEQKEREKEYERDKKEKTKTQRKKKKKTKKRGDDGGRDSVYITLSLSVLCRPLLARLHFLLPPGPLLPPFPLALGIFLRARPREHGTRERRLVVARLPSVSRPTTLGPNPHLRLEVDTRFSASLYLFAL